MLSKSIPGYIAVSILLALVITGCTVEKAPVNSYPVQETVDSSQLSKVSLIMGEGRLDLARGDDNSIGGVIQNNSANWNPIIQALPEGLTLSQGDISRIMQKPSDSTVNDWEIRLSDQPTDLFVEARGYYGDLDLTGVKLQTFRILDSFSQTEIRFDELNPVEMEILEIGSASSTFKIAGLANANFDRMNFRGVGGNYTLDFSGNLQRDTPATVVSGLGYLRVEVPSHLSAVVNATGDYQKIQVLGPWIKNGNVYENPMPGNRLNLEIKMDMGQLILVMKE